MAGPGYNNSTSRDEASSVSDNSQARGYDHIIVVDSNSGYIGRMNIHIQECSFDIYFGNIGT